MLENLKVKTRRKPYSCAVRTFYESLSEADKVILMDALCDPDVSHNGLSRALREQANTRLADTSIAKHRQGLCSCSKI
jgi:RNase P/RNase MRP subunit POP5